MHAEIIAVGTEILLGQIVDTNTRLVGQVLADLGIDVYYQTVVGDNEVRMRAAIDLAAKRSDLVILTGGLGPTKDDLTKQVVAAYLGKQLVEDEAAMLKIKRHFEISQRKMTANNRLQALYIEGSKPLANETGLAVGDFYQAEQGPDFMLLPGPPSELRPMLFKVALPLLKQAYRQDQLLSSRVLRFFGIGESQLASQLDDLIENQTNPTIAPYAKDNEVTLRLTASAKDEQEAQHLLDGLESKIAKRCGQYLYGYGDDNSLAQVVMTKLREKHLTITAAESLTGGQLQAALTSIPGASQAFMGGFVTYANYAKEKLLAIPAEVIDKHGSVSEQTAILMAEQAKQKLGADVGVSLTGVAGPDSLEGQPVGTVWIGIAYRNKAGYAQKFHFPRQRKYVQARAVLTALDLVRKELLSEN
ncbi:competence/damage-inducible protein A [Ligilactobacillus agilis]|uniref:Putative competence-damage inducible protein n=1 Tax=Ligilactobacillus agilis TaxID=1601 RepID=A0A226RC73_9LACO|nr:competence/damage-inducible protein A [Ligilactobacillus agilis]OXC07007.1 competence/damage-inducible protein A [Ligilactobacillus agilis]OXC08324.1 competence/damage-inducible protein A [Ligilactobacillus agilis]OXC09206.1 competence/damage-inducible protein A [Ligilactobacillus agilis]OXS38212.1 competence/damage-inducible protein A [Ligilactobacillus agilis]OXS40141.1 competence/damage-inducible protein A [Ligilactobacillus agilis]